MSKSEIPLHGFVFYGYDLWSTLKTGSSCEIPYRSPLRKAWDSFVERLLLIKAAVLGRPIVHKAIIQPGTMIVVPETLVGCFIGNTILNTSGSPATLEDNPRHFVLRPEPITDWRENGSGWITGLDLSGGT